MKSERGFALITALALAILYFALMELMMIDSLRSLGEARRYKARVIAQAMAESGAELAAIDLVTSQQRSVSDQDEQGDYSGRLTRSGINFELTGEGVTSGVVRQKATVRLIGRVMGTNVVIDYAVHSQ